MMEIQQLNHTIGEVVKTWRRHRGLKSSELAKAADLSPSYLSQLEHNKIRQPSELALVKLAVALDIKATDMLTRCMPPSGETAFEIQTSAQSSHDNSSNPGHLQPKAVGAYVEQMLASASLSDSEKHLVGEQIMGLTHNIVQLVTTTRQLQQTDTASIQKIVHRVA